MFVYARAIRFLSFSLLVPFLYHRPPPPPSFNLSKIYNDSSECVMILICFGSVVNMASYDISCLWYIVVDLISSYLSLCGFSFQMFAIASFSFFLYWVYFIFMRFFWTECLLFADFNVRGSFFVVSSVCLFAWVYELSFACRYLIVHLVCDCWFSPYRWYWICMSILVLILTSMLLKFGSSAIVFFLRVFWELWIDDVCKIRLRVILVAV